ncbi:MAG: sugar-binding protein [Clostridiales bacterium]|jgi:putative multiple sugar transport system substrate-binding protein|nr:sugar-binding protein [Clostridiales bacterium]
MKKFFSIVAASLLALSVGCGGGAGNPADPNSGNGNPPAQDNNASNSSGDVQVGIILPTKDEPRWIQDQTRFENGLTQAGFTSSVLFSQGSSATERSNVEALVGRGAKVIIICPQDGTAAAGAVDEAKQSGATVIAYDRLITNTENLDYYVGFDSKAVGEAQGEYLLSKATGNGNPLYLYSGAATDNNAFDFFAGAWSVLQPKIQDGTFVIANSSEALALADKAELDREELGKILGQITTDWDFNVAKTKAEANLTSADAKLKGNVFILAPNDGTARSIADTFAADTAVTHYEITGQDVEIPSVQYIIDGKQSMTVFKDTRELTEAAIKLASQVLNGETPETTTTQNNGSKEVPSKILDVKTVTKDNVKEAIIDTGYYDASQFTGLE